MKRSVAIGIAILILVGFCLFLFSYGVSGNVISGSTVSGDGDSYEDGSGDVVELNVSEEVLNGFSESG
jgi:hypothetical protein